MIFGLFLILIGFQMLWMYREVSSLKKTVLYWMEELRRVEKEFNSFKDRESK